MAKRKQCMLSKNEMEDLNIIKQSKKKQDVKLKVFDDHNIVSEEPKQDGFLREIRVIDEQECESDFTDDEDTVSEKPETNDFLKEIQVIDEQECESDFTDDEDTVSEKPETNDFLKEIQVIDEQECESDFTDDEDTVSEKPETNDFLKEIRVIDEQECESDFTDDEDTVSEKPETNDFLKEIRVIDEQECESDFTDDEDTVSEKPETNDFLREIRVIDEQKFETDWPKLQNTDKVDGEKSSETTKTCEKNDKIRPEEVSESLKLPGGSCCQIDNTTSWNTYDFALYILKKYKIRYLDKNDNILWIFNGKAYMPLNDKNLLALIYQEIPQKEKTERNTCKKIKENVAEYIKDECYHGVITQKNRPYCKFFTPKDMQRINGKVVLDNGIYDVKRDQLSNFDSNLPFYYQIHAKYLSNVNTDDLRTPYFDKLLSDATGGDQESIDMIWYVMGMLILPNRCKKFPVVGPASNSGKSVLFGNFLESLIDGDRVSKIDPGELGGKFALGNAESKILISCLDVNMEEISAKAVGTIKRATGEERIKVERKFKDQQDIVVRFKFLFGTNGKFSPAKYDAGWANRIMVVPFIYGMPEEKQNPELIQRLLEEKDMIITKILRKMRDVIDNNGMITIPESRLSLEIKKKWTLENTYVEEFFREMICVTGENADISSSEEIYRCYCKYARTRAEIEKGICSTVPMAQLISSIIQMSGGRISKKRMRVDGSQNPKRKIIGLRLNKGML